MKYSARLNGTLYLRFTKGDLLALPTKQGADPEGWVDWVASHPPLWGRLSLKL